MTGQQYIYIYIYIYIHTHDRTNRPNLPAMIVPTKIRRLIFSGEFPMDIRIPSLEIKIVLEST